MHTTDHGKVTYLRIRVEKCDLWRAFMKKVTWSKAKIAHTYKKWTSISLVLSSSGVKILEANGQLQ